MRGRKRQRKKNAKKMIHALKRAITAIFKSLIRKEVSINNKIDYR